MTASALKRPRLAGLRARSTEAVVFSFAAVLALAHAFDDALLLPGPGVPLTRHAIALAIAVAATVAAIVKFEADPAGPARGDRVHVRRAGHGQRRPSRAPHDPGGNDRQRRDRRDRARRRRRADRARGLDSVRASRRGHRGPVKRWVIRVAVLPLGLLAAMFVYMPVGMAIVDIHSLHRAVGNPPSAEYETLDADHLRRPRPRRLVPPVAQRRRRADAVGRERRHPRHDQPREDARPPRLRRPALQRARDRRQRRHAQLLRLGPGEGRGRRARLSRHAQGRPARARGCARPVDRRRHGDRHRGPPQRRERRGRRRHRRDRLRGPQGVHDEPGDPH